MSEDLVREFLAAQSSNGAVRESVTLELKRSLNRTNVVKAIAAMANTDGGLVIVGVDEDDPAVGPAAGVPQDKTRLAIADQCRTMFTPAFVPEIYEIPLSSSSTGGVILVIRVERLPDLRPVVLNGVVYKRSPGASVPATHDDILNLVRRTPTSAVGSTPVMALSSFSPTPRAWTVGSTHPDAIIRTVGALWRRQGASPMRLGTVIRQALLRTVEQSALVHGLHAGPSRNGASPKAATKEQTSTYFESQFAFSDGEFDHRLQFRSQIQGPRVTFTLDLEVRNQPVSLVSPRIQTPNAPTLYRTELAALLLEQVELVALALPTTLADVGVDGILRVDPPVSWVMTDPLPIVEVLDLRDASRAGGISASSYCFQASQEFTDKDAVRGELRQWLEEFYLDLGCEHESELAERDLTSRPFV
ncbi:hypothetical protein GCM10009740_38480 [Terrabacter terrae]|uniref:Schlafen AlbA-2 domain-containing protein n=1 Tax=Terrabacter terrae TaxID=318434 RepID=A0ABN1ZQ27_9MICO